MAAQPNKKKVYINQFNTPSSRNLMPLAAGMLYSYARSIPRLNENFDFQIEIMRDSPEKIVSRYESPSVIAFAAYFWNLNQSFLVAKAAKKQFPNALIVFGGPSMPIHDWDIPQFFEAHPYIDVIVSGEGEIAFAEILERVLERSDLMGLQGISYRLPDGNVVIGKKREPNMEVDKLPSPLLDGTFDMLLERYGEHMTGTVWESNRGCPFTCSFCYWGGPDSKIVQFSMDRVLKELDWIAKNKISYIFGADANFGILKRDLDIAKYMAKLHKETGYPKILVINWTKNATEKIFDIADSFNDGGITFMLTTSVQSHNPATLEAIKRSNIRLETFQNILSEAAKRSFNTYSELILGLPLETYDTFKAGIRKTLVPNLNYHFNIYTCFIIPGAEMYEPEYVKKYEIQTRHCRMHFGKAVELEGSVPEYNDVVVSTSTMPVEDWKKSYSFGYFTKALYGFRAAYFVMNYLRSEFNIDPIELVEFMVKEANENREGYPTIFNSLDVLDQLENLILNNIRDTIKLEGVATTLHPEVACFVALLSNHSGFYAELYTAVKKYLAQKQISADENVLKEIFAHQIARIPHWDNKNLHKLKFSYNVHEYFTIKQSLRKTQRKYIIGQHTDFKDIDEFMLKEIYGGMIFAISKVKTGDVDNFTVFGEFRDASRFFNELLEGKLKIPIAVKKI